MKKLLLMIFSIATTGCSISNHTTESVTVIESINQIQQCDFKLDSGVTYWSRVENNAIYLFMNQGRDKCLLRHL